MALIVSKAEKVGGNIVLPPSKSHTIRAVVIALLADGESIIHNPLETGDGLSALNASICFGAKIKKENSRWMIKGVNSLPRPITSIIDIGNSGTTLSLMSSIAALQEKLIKFDGDSSIRKRPIQPLLDALVNLGAEARSIGNNGCAPINVKGKIKGGNTGLDGSSSQYLSSLLLACPLAKQETTISVKLLNEKPYVEMTCRWLDGQNIKYSNQNMQKFIIAPNQSFTAFEKVIPADWSAAAFPICLSAVTKSRLTLTGLDVNDSQGDKRIIEIIKQMGAKVKINLKEIEVDCKSLKGITVDLNDCPDMLPALSVIACFAKGTTKIDNVPQARIKECDRIKVMCKELKKMGANINETRDGIIVKESVLKSVILDGHNDHRVIMALACAASFVESSTKIINSSNIDISFPNFIEKMNMLGADMKHG